MKKIALFSAGGIALAILLVLLTTGAKSNTAFPESPVCETVVADTTATAETEKIPEATETIVVETTETETTPTAETIDPSKTKEPAAPAAQIVKTKTEPEPEEHGLIIGDYHEPAPYSCGVAGHHCEGPETHSYICELEQKGCEYCGSHNCPSFYAVDQWGQGCYTPSKCPKYDVHADPVYYCQTCHKPCGDGRNGTCVQFVVACNCPNCGEQVPAWTCHYCE